MFTFIKKLFGIAPKEETESTVSVVVEDSVIVIPEPVKPKKVKAVKEKKVREKKVRTKPIAKKTIEKAAPKKRGRPAKAK